MARPSNSGWLGGAPVLMAHEQGGYVMEPMCSLSSTAFSFEENPVEDWAITNRHSSAISYSFVSDSQETIQSCLIKPSKGTIEVGEIVHGKISAKKPVDSPKSYEMTLQVWDTRQKQDFPITINRSKRDHIPPKEPKKSNLASSSSSNSPGLPPASDKKSPEGKTPSSSTGTPPPHTRSASDDRPADRTLDFTYIVVFAVLLAMFWIVHDYFQSPALSHPVVVAPLFFILGVCTYWSSGLGALLPSFINLKTKPTKQP